MGIKLVEDIYTDKSKENAVLGDDPAAAFLLGRKGQTIDNDTAKKYGIKKADEKEEAAADERTKLAAVKAAVKKKKDKAEVAEQQEEINRKVAKRQKELNAKNDKEVKGGKNK